MKHTLTIVLAIFCCLLFFPTQSFAGAKQDKRVAYVLAQMKLPTETARKLKPMLQSYLKDKKDASSKYDALKDKYKAAIKKGVITDKQADELLKEKFSSDQKELDVKKTYSSKFRTVLSPKKTYICFTLLNDKWSKIEGGNSNDDDEEE